MSRSGQSERVGNSQNRGSRPQPAVDRQRRTGRREHQVEGQHDDQQVARVQHPRVTAGERDEAHEHDDRREARLEADGEDTARRRAGAGRAIVTAAELELSWRRPQAPRPPSGWPGRMPSSPKNEYSAGASEIVHASTTTGEGDPEEGERGRLDVSEPEPLPGLERLRHRAPASARGRDLVGVEGVLLPLAATRARAGREQVAPAADERHADRIAPLARPRARRTSRPRAARDRRARRCSSTRPTCASGSPSSRRPGGRREEARATSSLPSA